MLTERHSSRSPAISATPCARPSHKTAPPTEKKLILTPTELVYGSASEDGASEDESPSSHVDERHQSSKRRRKRPILRLWLPNFVSSPARLDWARRRGALERSHADSRCARMPRVTARLQSLRFAREELRLPCDSVSFSRAAEGGHLHCLRYLHENGCPKSRSAFSMAAKGGHLHVLEYLRIEMGLTPDPTDEGICETAARQGRRDILEWAHSNFGCAWGRTCEYAAAKGHLACLQYAHENGCWWKSLRRAERRHGGGTSTASDTLTRTGVFGIKGRSRRRP